MADASDDLVVVTVDEVDPDPVVVLVDPPELGDVAVVAVEGAPAAGRGAIFLDELRDVDAPARAAGVLERQDDGVVRPTTREALLAEHRNDPTPHPAYDDMVDLTLIFENGLV